jgi:hypothetical protein
VVKNDPVAVGSLKVLLILQTQISHQHAQMKYQQNAKQLKLKDCQYKNSL